MGNEEGETRGETSSSYLICHFRLDTKEPYPGFWMRRSFLLTISHQPLPGHMTHDSCRSPTLIAPQRTQIPTAVIFLFKFETSAFSRSQFFLMNSATFEFPYSFGCRHTSPVFSPPDFALNELYLHMKYENFPGTNKYEKKVAPCAQRVSENNCLHKHSPKFQTQ